MSTGTGVSAVDRATTVRALGDPQTAAVDLRRPGHIFPLRYREGGVLVRAGHTEASVDLLRLAGRRPIATITELVADDGSMAHGAGITDFARHHDVPAVSVGDIVRYRRSAGETVGPTGAAIIPTRHGDFRAIAFRSTVDGLEHLALVLGEVGDGQDVLVRVHSECLTGDVIASLRCDCGTQREAAMKLIGASGCGVLVYLRGHEGRGIGLGYKLRAYDLQDRGRDTVSANVELGLPVDSREYGTGAEILAQLGVRSLRLITNNPAKHVGLSRYGLHVVERIALPPVVTAQNRHYLRTKRDRMHHDLKSSELTARDEPAGSVRLN